MENTFERFDEYPRSMMPSTSSRSGAVHIQLCNDKSDAKRINVFFMLNRCVCVLCWTKLVQGERKRKFICVFPSRSLILTAKQAKFSAN